MPIKSADELHRQPVSTRFMRNVTDATLVSMLQVYGDEAEAFINEACEKAINAYKNLSGQA